MEINEYFLMSCPNMVGFNEGWVIDNHVFVSPAIFQLLTDEDDNPTRICVARQLVLKQATYRDLKALLAQPARRVMSEMQEYDTFVNVQNRISR